MKKIYIIVLVVVLSLTLTGCGFGNSIVLDDLEDCINSECTAEEMDTALDAFIDYAFRDKYDDTDLGDDVNLSTHLIVEEDEYTIIFDYEQIGDLFGFGSAPITIDLLHMITVMEEELIELETEKSYVVISKWFGELQDMDLEMSFYKKSDTDAAFFMVVTDYTDTYDTPLSEVLAFLGTFELLMEYKETSVHFTFETNVGDFVLHCEDESFEYVLRYTPLPLVNDPDTNFDVFKDIVNAEKREAYTVITE